MWQQILTYLLLTATPAASSYAYACDLAEVIYGPSGVCSISGTITVEKQPVYYSEYVNSNTVIDPFHDGHPITITDAPTVVVVLSYITTTVTPTSIPVGQMSTPNALSSMNPMTTSPGVSASPSSPSTSIAMSMASQSVPTSAQTSAVAPSGAPVNSTPTTANLAIGQDFPSGTITSLPSGSNIILALANLNAQRLRMLRRQDSDSAAATAAVSASPIALVDLTPVESSAISASALPTGQHAVSEDDCDHASPLHLSSGSLLTSGFAAIGKLLGASSALLGPLGFNASVDQVNTGFLFVDGILHWNAPDVGEASFYSCEGVIWAGFPSVPSYLGICEQVVVGGIGAQACAARVEENGGVVNPNLTAPILIDEDSATSTVYTTTSLTTTSSLYTTLTMTSSPATTSPTTNSPATNPTTNSPGTTLSTTSAISTTPTTTGSLATTSSNSVSPSTSLTPSSGIRTSSLLSTSVSTSGLTGTNTTPMTSTPTTQASTTTFTTTSAIPSIDPNCNQDNCLRNLEDPRYYTQALTFCPTYTMTSAIPIPSWLGGCYNSTQATSACGCLLPLQTPSSNGTTSMTNSSNSAMTTPTSASSPTAPYSNTTTSTSPMNTGINSNGTITSNSTIASNSTAPITSINSTSPVCNLTASVCLNSTFITSNTVYTQNCSSNGTSCTTSQSLAQVSGMVAQYPTVKSVLLTHKRILGLGVTGSQLQSTLANGTLITACATPDQVVIDDVACASGYNNSSTPTTSGNSTSPLSTGTASNGTANSTMNSPVINLKERLRRRAQLQPQLGGPAH
ncbi:hypothetical protein LTR10_022305 [Elasticomyces elasticus]|uniref:LysM domain-containing protein n=1 Tax=Exophiala sideris TaxID=1016849 RepID=A0ABR0J660_9EURO|nr:hypothetical protein LTR10_022305 [Elasticomyces elasticus]KAK5028785.1 hypothetical protein LTS07_006164 [Exophiala sideris]KAK5035654.1 hypothetical protein LTR13_005783 [Exophiala sideris]KAK5057289.1 hypothetical protein LTR69_007328 [Exophiala sideris]KAK5181738.1 hypothetical protein LTR44_005938 [Eurotiomycetes sp. CCFEE 6388]